MISYSIYIVDDEEVIEEISNQQPYGKWLDENLVEFDKLPSEKVSIEEASSELLKSFGYIRED